MFCGFGAVVLLVLIINANIVSTRNERYEDLRAEAARRELELLAGEEHLAALKENVITAEQARLSLQTKLKNVQAALKSRVVVLSQAGEETARNQQTIAALQRELKALDAGKKELAEKSVVTQRQGNTVRRFEGEGNRQYLTGLKLGGKRVLILIDTSASMLDKTVVNIIRRRVRDDRNKQQAPKWKQAVRTVEWAVANLPSESSLNVYGFNTAAASLVPAEQKAWIPLSDMPVVDRIIAALQAVVPNGGTSLENAFAAVQKMRPRPDNILLLTDGLPTQGKNISKQNTVSGEERVKLFEKALQQLPPNIPVNTILFPMEGDPFAAALFWKLAVDSGGSFLTPTSDWP